MPLTQNESHVNSLVAGRCGSNFELVIFKLSLVIDIMNIPCENALRQMLWGLSDDKSMLVQAMAWCRQTPEPMLTKFHDTIWSD